MIQAKKEKEECETECFGNAFTTIVHEFNFNRNQLLNFNESENTLTFVGERHPLAQDGGLDIIKQIAGGDLTDLKVVEYQTSDNRLHWHETLSDYMFTRACPSEFFEYSKKEFSPYPAELVERNGGYLPPFVAKCHELLEQHGLLQCLMDIKRNKPEAQLRASWKPDELKLVRTIEDFLP